MAAEGYASGLRELAIAVGLQGGPTQLYSWRAAGAPLTHEPGRGYPIEPLRRWAEENRRGTWGTQGRPLVATGAGIDPTSRDRLLKAQADEREAKAALAALQLAIERREYIPRAEMESRDLARIAAVKRGLLGLPKAVAHLVVGLSPPEAEALLATKVRDLLEKFAQM